MPNGRVQAWRTILGLPVWLLLCATSALAATPRNEALGPAHALRVKGRDLVDPSGQVVLLRGVNLGGWLVTEGWMCGQRDSRERWAWEQLEERFGAAKAEALMNDWFDNWIGEGDLDTIRSWGFNLVRVPFSYRTLQDAAGAWRRDARGQVDFRRLDWIVAEAGRRGLYVVLDLHVWQGQRDDYQRISRAEPGGEIDRAQAAALWREVARHFKGHAAIAGFDVINEPEGSPDNLLQRVLYEAIRSQDPERVVILESVAADALRAPAWQQVVWSGHYPTSDQDPGGTIEERVDRWAARHGLDRQDLEVPVFVGEMKAPEDSAESARALAEAMDRRGWSWAVWTYRAVSSGGWAAFNYHDAMTFNLAEDPYGSLRAKWTQGLQQGSRGGAPRHAHWNDWWIEGFRAHARPERQAGRTKD